MYFSDRERGLRPRTNEEIAPPVWAALQQSINNRIDDGSFGGKFPDVCPDKRGPFGTDRRSFDMVARGEIPGLSETWLYAGGEIPDTLTILDVLEFCARSIAKPIQRDFHKFPGHYHLDFDRVEGLREFIADVDRLFARNGIAFELSAEGQAVRLGPVHLREALAMAVFHTGDSETDRLLEESRRLFLSPRLDERRRALETLWDAFERIKTLEPGADKRASVTAILDKTTKAPGFRGVLEREARELTDIGNALQIRHHETSQERLQHSEDLDYLFHRLFSFTRLVLHRTGREG